jgi:hypothetical protein
MVKQKTKQPIGKIRSSFGFIGYKAIRAAGPAILAVGSLLLLRGASRVHPWLRTCSFMAVAPHWQGHGPRRRVRFFPKSPCDFPAASSITMRAGIPGRIEAIKSGAESFLRSSSTITSLAICRRLVALSCKRSSARMRSRMVR